MLESKQNSAYDDPSKTFLGARFVLLGFDPVEKEKIRSRLVEGGGFDAVNYGPNCTHVIVDKLVYDDPICVTARKDRKTLVTALWVDHSFDVGMPVDPTSVIYRPVRDLNGIPGANSLVVCLTGYQRHDREDIMTMVGIMGANFSKPLVANKVTHLICYKFEGEKYELAKKMEKIKLVNHCWLEDCLKAWEMLPESGYRKSGYELEMEAEAKDSEDETEDIGSIIAGERKYIASPQVARFQNRSSHLSPGKQEISRNSSYLSAPTNLANNGSTSNFDKSSALQETGNRHLGMPSSSSAKSPENVEKILPSAFESAKKSPSDDTSKLISKSYSRKNTPSRSSFPLSSERTEINASGSKSAEKIDKLRVGDVTKIPLETPKDGVDGFKTPRKGTVVDLDEGQTATLSEKRKSTELRANSKSPKSIMTERLASGPINVSSRVTRSFSPLKEASLASKEASIVSKSNVTEDRQECSEVALQRSGKGLKKTILSSDLGVKDLTFGRNGSSTSKVEARQIDLQSFEPPFHVGAEESSVQTDSKIENTSSQSKSLKKKKTLGSRPSISKAGNATKNKGPINLKKVLVQNEFTSPSVKAVEDENKAQSSITEKTQMNDLHESPQKATDKHGHVGDENIAQELLVENDFEGARDKEKSAEVEEVLSGKDKRIGVHQGTEKQARKKLKQAKEPWKATDKDGPMDDENEAQELLVGNDFDGVRNKDKPAEVEASGLGKDRRVGTHGTEKQANKKLKQVKEKVAKSAKDQKGMDDIEATTSKKGELTESIPACYTREEEKSTKSKKRPLTKTKAKKSKEPNEEAEKNVSNSKKADKDMVSGDEETVALAGKTKKRPSKKLKTSCGMEKENEPVTVSNDDMAPESLQKTPKISVKTIKQTPASGTHGKLEVKTVPAPTWFILSGHKLQRKEFQQVIKRLKGRVCRDSHHWSYQATHFIVPDPIRRTEKFFAAAASGSWILKTDYLTASHEAGRFLSEEQYEWHKKGLSEDGAINLEAPRKWRLMKEKTGHGAFYGMRIIIYGECIAPPLDTLKRVIKAGEGTILATSPPYTRFLQLGIDFAIVSSGMPRVDMWVQEFLRHEVPCVVADYLVEYVCKTGYSLDRHVQYNTHAWAKKSLENIMSRVEEIVEDVRTPDRDEDADVACRVCGSYDRGEEMLICGDEGGTLGCGVGTHFDCLDPPLLDVPEKDWYCNSCSVKRESKARSRTPKKRGSKSKK